MTLPIRIMTRDFRLLGQVDRYSSLQITRSWHGIGSIELVINRYLKGADKLLMGRIIFPHNQLNKAFVIKERKIELDENGKATENWIITALSLKSWFSQRITLPPEGKSQNSIEADAESAMRHYANDYAVNPIDPSDVIPDLVLADNLNRGESISWQSRLKELSSEMTDIGFASGLGWNISIDAVNKKFVFEVLEGRDLTASQSILPPAIFSPEFKTLGQMSYMESELEFKNYAIVAGQGEGAERRIVTVGDESATGFDRHVLFVDARDVAEETDEDPPQPIPVEKIEERLRARGLQKLAEHQQEVYLEGQALTKSRLVYEKDWDLGDVVTQQNRDWGVTLDARITEVKEIYEPGKTSIEPVFGNNRPTLISKIKQELAGMKVEMTR